MKHRVATREAFEALSQSARLPLQFRTISRDTPHLDLQGFRTPHLSIWTIDSATGFESVPLCEVDVFSIRIPLRGGLQRRTGRQDHTMRPGEATILAASDILSTRCEPGSTILGCTITAETLRRRHEALESSDGSPLVLSPSADTGRLPVRALIHTLQQLSTVSASEANGLMGPLLEDLLMNQLLTAWPSGRPGEAAATAGAGPSRIMSHAVDYIEAHLGTPITISDVAAAARVSVRTLQSVFRTQTGHTPLGYILERRMDQAHADLLASEGRLQVSQIAYRWGFLHMGDFSRRYRMRYGCAPSQTNRRTR